MRKAIAAAVVAALWATPSLAQQCMPVGNMVNHMIQYEAQIVSSGVGARGRITVWVDRDGDFYIVGIPTDNPAVACLLEMGKNWESLPPKPQNPA
jgi:hypothetical protein